MFGDFEDDGVGVEEPEEFDAELVVHAADTGEVAVEGLA